MAEIEWLVAADYAFYDQGKKVCLIGVFSTIFTPTVPAQHPVMGVAMKVVGNPGERFQTRLQFKRPAGQVLFELNGQGELSNLGAADLT